MAALHTSRRPTFEHRGSTHAVGKKPSNDLGFFSDLLRRVLFPRREKLALRKSADAMNPTTWLETKVPGFRVLPARERKAITDFSLLWSLYESTVLERRGNANTIISSVGLLKERRKLTLTPFLEAIEYFRARYYNGHSFNHEFDGLLLRRNDHKPLVEKVLRRERATDDEILSAILIIVLRLRNNFFHGEKWAYELRGQLNNFNNANSVLMSVMDLHSSRYRARLDQRPCFPLDPTCC